MHSQTTQHSRATPARAPILLFIYTERRVLQPPGPGDGGAW